MLSCVKLFAIPWTAVRQASLSFTVSRSLLKLMSIKSIKSVMPSNYFILCRPLLLLPSVFPSIRVFSNGQSIGVSASASVPPMNIQDCFPLGLTDLISKLVLNILIVQGYLMKNHILIGYICFHRLLRVKLPYFTR